MGEKRVTRPEAQMTNRQGKGFGSIISRHRQRAGLTQAALARRLGVTVSAVGNWEAGLRRPDLNIVAQLCETLDISIGTLFGTGARLDELQAGERSLIGRYRSLTETNRHAISRLVDTLLERQAEQLSARVRDIRRIVRSELKACAGLGNALDEARGEEVFVHLPGRMQRADEIVTVTGDSMEPTFHDGDQVLLEHCERIGLGEVGIFVGDGTGYIKELRRDVLFSHNPAYAPIPLASFDQVRCVGRVVGVVTDEDYASDEEIAALHEMDLV